MSTRESGPRSFLTYGVAIQEVGGRRTQYSKNADERLETMSAIKSPIGSLALEKAASEGHDIETFTLDVLPAHYSNGSGTLRELEALQQDRPNARPIPMRMNAILYANVVESDCVAINVLIDYLGGKDRVNEALSSELGLESMELMTDRIYFTGVDHHEQPFQVGRASMRDFMRYYETIWSPDSRWTPRSPIYPNYLTPGSRDYQVLWSGSESPVRG